MTLDDVLNAGESFLTISSVANAFKEDSTNPAHLSRFLGYTASLTPDEPIDVDALGQELSRNPFQLRMLMENDLVRAKDSLIDAVEGKYKSVIYDFEAEDLRKLAIGIPDESKNWIKVAQKLQEKDYEGVREAYVQTFTNPVWKEFIESASHEFVVSYAGRYTSFQQDAFVKTNLSRQDGKFSPTKARRYIHGKTDELDEETRKGLYLDVGQIWTGGKLRERAQAEQRAAA